MPPKKKAAEEFKAPEATKATRLPHKEATSLGMLGHMQIPVTDIAKSLAFYDKALTPLGYSRLHGDDTKKIYCYGPPGKYIFWITQIDKHYSKVQENDRYPGLHLCLTAPSRRAVHEFHEAALEFGGTDGGAPGKREYTPNYYAAYSFDPDGWKLEVAYMDEPQEEDEGLEDLKAKESEKKEENGADAEDDAAEEEEEEEQKPPKKKQKKAPAKKGKK